MRNKPEQLKRSLIEDLKEPDHREIAKNLFETYIQNQPDHTNNTEPSIDTVLARIPEKILKRYWGHGVTRGSSEHQIAAAISILQDRFILGTITPLTGSGYLNAYTNGSFLAISRKDEDMSEYRHGRDVRVRIQKEDGSVIFGVKVDPGALVCNKSMDTLVEPLRQMFPDRKILHADELYDFIKRKNISGPFDPWLLEQIGKFLK